MQTLELPVKLKKLSFALKVFLPPGYTVVWSGEPEKTEETPLKKYQRLNCEVSPPNLKSV